MQFRSCTVFDLNPLNTGSCNAVRVEVLASKSVLRVPVSAVWLAETQAKQRAYERDRAERRKALGIVDTN